ncbi:hypothetical protein CHS0354_016143 [Potamilus streckersoni]|uniref:Peroxisome assembly protein 26 n=1 Tax=Potamilus streckersoni TaxID=2493646 RepID=A0AAE0T0Y6_9BIVA|nr:hypothetical protein CHS0354_016143 [Potamilus streckersoni]
MASGQTKVLSYRTNVSNNFDKSTLVRQFDEYKETATELLLFRDFRLCISACQSGINHAKIYIEVDGAREVVESLTLIAIQAYAELNSWQEVLPFIQQVYNGIETCPPRVVQFCILLHAKVKEYAQCHAITNIWLRCPDNASIEGYFDVVQLYVLHVMLPQEKEALVPSFLDNCNFLSTEQRQIIMSEMRQSLAERESKSKDSKELETKASEKPLETDENASHGKSALLKALKRFGVVLAKKCSFLSFDTVMKIAVVAVSFYFLMIQANKGDLMTDLGRATAIVWKGAVNHLYTLFSPARPGR